MNNNYRDEVNLAVSSPDFLPQAIPDRVLTRTAPYHAMVDAMESRCRVLAMREGIPLSEFPRLCTQYIWDFVSTNNEPVSKTRIRNYLRDWGVLAVKDYSVMGMCGEGTWVKNARYTGEHYRVNAWEEILPHDSDVLGKVSRALVGGAVYIDFYAHRSLLGNPTIIAPIQAIRTDIVELNPDLRKKFMLQPGVVVGFGRLNDQTKRPYFIYLNSRGAEFGQTGLAEFSWMDLVTYMSHT